MALRTVVIPPFDPYLFTGPVRATKGVGRTGIATPGTPYGEFATKLYVGTTGNISYIKWDGTTQVLNSIAAGVWHDILSQSVNSSGTTATDIVWGS